ncbi:MAG: hypothetical protein IPO41_04815 [Acidobacteria bacterium]|nr:hypothetical protein [Acidobacteriota bacterium]
MAMSKTAKTFLIVGGITLILLFFGFVGLVLIADSMGKPSVANNSVLVLNISGELPDYVAEEPLAKAFGVKQPQSFTSLLTQLRKAKVDNRIGAVVLDINFPASAGARLMNSATPSRISGHPANRSMPTWRSG